ncbi:MFS transporter [Actinosynnema sp. NPDC020468]|uniref:MDR family MFS transporter n=1 Tax=Actinosynnema sp. NPDC020468 TaxID=3154488 RepID=UPI0033C96C68
MSERFSGAFWIICGASLLNRATTFVYPLLAFYLANSLGWPAFRIGLTLSAMGAGAVVGALVGGFATDFLGASRTLFLGQIGNAAAMLALGLVTTPYAIVGAAAVLGFTNSMGRPALNTLVAAIVRPAARTRAYSLVYWSANVGFAVAPVLGGVLSGVGWFLVFAVNCAALVVVGLVLVLTVRPPREQPAEPGGRSGTRPRGSLIGVLRRDGRLPVLVVGTFILSCLFTQSTSTLPTALAADGFPPASYGLALSVNGVVIVLLQLPLTRVLERVDPAVSLVMAALLLGVGFGATAFAHDTVQVALCVAVWTLGEMLGLPVAATAVTNLAPAGMRGRYHGLYTLSMGAAGSVAPALGGAVLQGYGSALWFWCLALGCVGGVLFFFLRGRLGESAPEPEPAGSDARGHAEG